MTLGSMQIDDIAFHEVFCQDEYVVHEAVVRNDFAWIGLSVDERWHSVRVQFDTLAHLAKVWVDDTRRAYAPSFTVDYDQRYTKSYLRTMGMGEVMDWLF